MGMTNAHANCDHPATKTARAKCRKEAFISSSTAKAEAIALVNHFREMNASRSPWAPEDEWTFKAAAKFGRYHGDDVYEAAAALLSYFSDPAIAASAGRTPTKDPATIRRIALLSFA